MQGILPDFHNCAKCEEAQRCWLRSNPLRWRTQLRLCLLDSSDLTPTICSDTRRCWPERQLSRKAESRDAMPSVPAESTCSLAAYVQRQISLQYYTTMYHECLTPQRDSGARRRLPRSSSHFRCAICRFRKPTRSARHSRRSL